MKADKSREIKEHIEMRNTNPKKHKEEKYNMIVKALNIQIDLACASPREYYNQYRYYNI